MAGIYRCTNIGNCNKADSEERIPLMAGADPICPGCGSRLMEVSPERPKKVLPFLLGACSALVLGGIGLWFLTPAPILPEVERLALVAEWQAKLEVERQARQKAEQRAETERQARQKAEQRAEKAEQQVRQTRRIVEPQVEEEALKNAVKVYYQGLNENDCSSALLRREKAPTNFCNQVKNIHWFRLEKIGDVSKIDQDNVNVEVEVIGKNYSESPESWKGYIQLRKAEDNWKITSMANLQKVK